MYLYIWMCVYTGDKYIYIPVMYSILISVMYSRDQPLMNLERNILDHIFQCTCFDQFF